MKNLFIYGTLMFDDVWRQLTKNQYRKINAVLPEFIRLRVKNEDYPGIIPCTENTVSGELLFQVSASDIQLLDNFEGEQYRREQVKVISDETEYYAETYIFRNRFKSLLSDEEWDIDTFKDSGLSSFLLRYSYFIQQQ